jgi:antitoxin (DNA-binding transcriptional repressor) of toxin-antitoxin stability system
MKALINARELRAELPAIVDRVRKGSRFTVLYRSRPAFEIVPVGDAGHRKEDLSNDSFYGSGPLGSSASGNAATRHDEVLYR